MPLLDVTSVLYDPMFMDSSGTYTRNVQTVGSNGRASLAPTTTQLFGVYTNKDGSLLTRGADSEYIIDSFTLHTQTKLTAGQTGDTADIVHWQGADYTVVRVANYSTYGAGFVMADCEILNLDGGSA